jgi:hypothetical protein
MLHSFADTSLVDDTSVASFHEVLRKLTSVTFNTCDKDFVTSTVNYMAPLCTRLAELSIHGLQGAYIKSETIVRIITNNVCLRHLRIEEFVLDFIKTDAILSALAESCPLLEILRLVNSSSTTSLPMIQKVIDRCPLVRLLDIGATDVHFNYKIDPEKYSKRLLIRQFIQLDLDLWWALLSRLTDLTYLDVGGVPLSSRFLLLIGDTSPRLSELHLVLAGWEYSAASLRHVLTSCHALSKLNLGNCEHLVDSDWIDIFSIRSNLTWLTIHSQPHITLRCVGAILQSCEKLVHLDLTGASRLTKPQLIKFVRDHHVGHRKGQHRKAVKVVFLK